MSSYSKLLQHMKNDLTTASLSGDHMAIITTLVKLKGHVDFVKSCKTIKKNKTKERKWKNSYPIVLIKISPVYSSTSFVLGCDIELKGAKDRHGYEVDRTSLLHVRVCPLRFSIQYVKPTSSSNILGCGTFTYSRVFSKLVIYLFIYVLYYHGRSMGVVIWELKDN